MPKSPPRVCQQGTERVSIVECMSETRKLTLHHETRHLKHALNSIVEGQLLRIHPWAMSSEISRSTGHV